MPGSLPTNLTEPLAQMTMRFAELSRSQQLSKLRRTALAMSQQFGITPIRMQLLSYGYNAVYKLTTPDGDIRVLKLVLDSPRSIEHLRAELEWCQHLNEAGITAPVPHSQNILTESLPGFHKSVHGLCLNWIPGRKVSRNPTEHQVGRVAQLAALLTQNPPPKSKHSFPKLTDTLAGVDHRVSDPLLNDAIDECNETISLLWQKQSATAIHNDLHNENVLVQPDGLIPFDFEFAHIAPPIIEVANMVFYYTEASMNFDPRIPVFAAFPFHYSDFGLNSKQFESLLISRKLMFCNDLHLSTNPELIEMLPRYTERTKLLVNHFNQTGRYDVMALA